MSRLSKTGVEVLAWPGVAANEEVIKLKSLNEEGRLWGSGEGLADSEGPAPLCCWFICLYW